MASVYRSVPPLHWVVMAMLLVVLVVCIAICAAFA